MRSDRESVFTRFGRLARRLGRRLMPAGVDFVFSPAYRLDLAAVPMDPQRGERILAFLLHEGLIHRRAVHYPRPASLKDLRLVHRDDYLERLSEPRALETVLGFIPPEPLRARLLEMQRQVTGGTLLAARRALLSGRVQVNLGGGLHHARADRGAGFCLFNDVAVAIRERREHGFEGRVLVVDLDLHDGDGTRAIFAEDPSVFTFSICNRAWSQEEAKSSLTLELGTAVDDSTYLAALRDHLPRVIESHQPELIFYLAGSDPAADDHLGDWRISARGMLERDRFVIAAARRHQPRPPLVVVLAGGYGNHAWSYSARFLAWLLTGRENLSLPSTTAVTLAHYRQLARRFTVGELTSEAGEDLWSLNEEDLYGGLGSGARETRFLGFYSQHGIELVLERTGILDRLRQKGFPHPTLELDLSSSSGHTARLFSDTDRTELLMEIRLSRDRRSLPDFELLRLEWLLLQNPRREFPTDRPPLPGQRHPGLGMLADVMALLVLICERLQLGGILFVPSHYHLAAKAQKFLRFLNPEDEAWLRAVREAVKDLELREATKAVSNGRVVEKETGQPVGWRAMPMVIPVGEELKQRVAGEDFDHAVERAECRFRFSLTP